MDSAQKCEQPHPMSPAGLLLLALLTGFAASGHALPSAPSGSGAPVRATAATESGALVGDCDGQR